MAHLKYLIRVKEEKLMYMKPRYINVTNPTKPILKYVYADLFNGTLNFQNLRQNP